MKVKLIYNPVSGNGTFVNNLDYIIEKFQKKGYQMEPYRTSKKKTIDEMLTSMNADEYKKILVAGGDGTINQVINGLIKYNINLPLGIFPVGTANDYAQSFNLPNSIEEIVEILLRDNYTYSDVGLVNDKYFVNVASLGHIIDISQKTNTIFKNSLGVLAYYINGISELPKIKPVNIQIKSNQVNFEGEILFMLIMNGKSAGGFNKIAPLASINDGLFEVIIFKNCSVYELLYLLLAVISGAHINNQNVIHFKTDELIVDTDKKVSTDIDGEKGSSFPLNIKILPKKLKIITRVNSEEGYIQQENYNFEDIKKAVEQISAGIANGVKKSKDNEQERNIIEDINEIIKDLPRHK